MKCSLVNYYKFLTRAALVPFLPASFVLLVWTWYLVHVPEGTQQSFVRGGLACSRLRDSGEKSFSKKEMQKTRGG